MKVIILGLAGLLMLAQNSFAETDVVYDKMIENFKDMPAVSQLFKCEKAALNHVQTADVNECLKSIKYIESGMTLGFIQEKKQELLAESYLNAGVIYFNKGDTLKAYRYFRAAAKHGNTTAQENLDILCKKSPWACK